MNRLVREERGFTLPELLITCIIALTVSLAAFSLLDYVMRRTGDINVRVETTQRGRTAMDQVTRTLRSQVCAWRNDDGTPQSRSLNAASPTSVGAFVDFSNESTSSAPALRELTYTPGATGGTLDEGVTPGAWSGTRVTYAGATTKTRRVLANVIPYQPVGSSDAPTPIFRYFRFPNATEQAALPAGTPPQPTVELGTTAALTADELESVARITVTFRVLSSRARDTTDVKGSQVLQNDVYVRTADPNLENPSPKCATL
jgi:prepilin-type N-terminal cleavage/methylation domain-containing protein